MNEKTKRSKRSYSRIGLNSETPPISDSLRTWRLSYIQDAPDLFYWDPATHDEEEIESMRPRGCAEEGWYIVSFMDRQKLIGPFTLLSQAKTRFEELCVQFKDVYGA